MEIKMLKLTKSPAEIILSHAQLAAAKALLKYPGAQTPPKGLIKHNEPLRKHVLNDMVISTGLVTANVKKRAGKVRFQPVLPGLRLAVDNTDRHLREQKTGAKKMPKAKAKATGSRSQKRAA